ncbi:MAG: HNH nuclease family protein [Deltaproteobacteria bacterium]|nr:HNH nuclease family protein [Deltaproteobacteria bacterium]
MAKVTFSRQADRTKTSTKGDQPDRTKPIDRVIRELREGARNPAAEDYRERSLAIHGLVCAYCSREFDHRNRHLLTVHHRDGNHHNNPPDGSNWENLCVYCHDNIHSREILGDYLAENSHDRSSKSVMAGRPSKETEGSLSTGLLAAKLQEALGKKKKK